MSGSTRTFGALVCHDGVTLVEYRAERTGMRVLGSWTDPARSASIDEALARLHGLVSEHSPKRATVALAVEQFGVVHHAMTLPGADDAVLRPVIAREIHRTFGVPDPVVAFTRGSPDERRGPDRANAATAPRQLLIAAAPRETVAAMSAALGDADITVATVVPKAMHALYEAAGAGVEATAVLVCLESGPHLAFFLDGRLELAIDPPIALEGDRPTPAMILDQYERGAVYFRQQFRGAAATRVLLAARAEDYDALEEGLRTRFGGRVSPLFAGDASPEAVIAMGAVLESQRAAPLDLFPHPPTAADRIAAAIRGPNAVVAVAAVAVAIALIWAGVGVRELSRLRSERETLRSAVVSSMPAVEPMRRVAERRADIVKQVEFVNASSAERASLASVLAQMASTAPQGITFDSLAVSRASAGWNVYLRGFAAGASAAAAMRALDGFVQSTRAVPSVGSATLEEFDYMQAADTSIVKSGVAAMFKLSASITRAEGPR